MIEMPTDAAVVKRLPHDKRGVPITPGCVVRYTDRLFGEDEYEVLSVSRYNTITIRSTRRKDYPTSTAGSTVEVIAMEETR